jgi:hypothetical protein
MAEQKRGLRPRSILRWLFCATWICWTCRLTTAQRTNSSRFLRTVSLIPYCFMLCRSLSPQQHIAPALDEDLRHEDITLALDEREWSDLHTGKQPHVTHCVGGWLDPYWIWMLWRREGSLTPARNRSPIPRPSNQKPVSIPIGFSGLHIPFTLSR